MRKSLLTALTLSAALSFVPAGLALAAPFTEAPMSAAAYSPLYTESSWMTLSVPVGCTRRHRPFPATWPSALPDCRTAPASPWSACRRKATRRC